MDFVFKFIKFGIVGGTGIIVDFSITWICKEKLQLNKYISNSIGFLFAATSNYILNRIWTFQSSNKQIVREYISFLFISLIGLGFNNLVIFILHEKMKMNFYFAKIIATGIVVLWNFFANYYFTFRPC
ncbi:GtrA family protein [Petrimonas sp.]|uniref:GtrA family protein n=1 Tax=Petrimonas sp. TaxID=2023866 RepID=UPI003F51543E